MNTRKVFAWLAATLLVAVMAAGCKGKDSGAVPEGEGDQPQQETQAETQATEETLPEYIEISTPYGTLRYQGKWMDSMLTAQTQTDSGLQIDFSAKIGDAEYALFSLVIGSGEGSPVGQLTDADGEGHDVYLIFEEIVMDPQLTEEEQNLLYAMQEDINYIIANLH